jgi:hypothetical protein
MQNFYQEKNIQKGWMEQTLSIWLQVLLGYVMVYSPSDFTRINEDAPVYMFWMNCMEQRKRSDRITDRFKIEIFTTPIT